MSLQPNLGGRPRKYTDEFLDNELTAFYEWMKKEDSVYFKNFCIQRGYSPTRLYEFRDEHKGFSEAMEFAKQWQEGKLIQLGLFRKIDAGITKFLLSAIHDMYDKSSSEGERKKIEPVEITIIDGRSSI